MYRSQLECLRCSFIDEFVDRLERESVLRFQRVTASRVLGYNFAILFVMKIISLKINGINNKKLCCVFDLGSQDYGN